MLKIFQVISRVVKGYYSTKSKEFNSGANEVLKLFEIGIRKHPNFNLSIRNKELELENTKLKEKLRATQKQLTKYNRQANKVLMSGTPAEVFREFIIKTVNGDFSIITNLSEETMYACSMSFGARYSFNKGDEAKSKMLSYINSKNYAGFYAYKDWKTYKKERKNENLK